MLSVDHSSPRRWANAAASTRPRTLSLRRMRETWTLAVLGLMNSSAPISRLVRPAATRRRTSRSRAVRSRLSAASGSAACAELDAAAPRQRADLLQQRPGAEPRRSGRGGAQRFGGGVALTERERGLGLAPAGVGAGGRDGERIGARDRRVPRGRIGRVRDAGQLGRAQRCVQDQLGRGRAGRRRGDLPGDPLGHVRRPGPRLALRRSGRTARVPASASSASTRTPTQCRRAVKNGYSWPSVRARPRATTSRAAAARPADSSSSAAAASTGAFHIADASVLNVSRARAKLVPRGGGIAARGRDLGDGRVRDSLRRARPLAARAPDPPAARRRPSARRGTCAAPPRSAASRGSRCRAPATGRPRSRRARAARPRRSGRPDRRSRRGSRRRDRCRRTAAAPARSRAPRAGRPRPPRARRGRSGRRRAC